MVGDPSETARLSAAAMWADDRASQALGMNILSVGEGSCIITMPVSATMVNGLGICHGGFIFTLADSACAFASNSYNQRALLQHGQITLLQPAKLGSMLSATATERHRGERTGIYDVTVLSDEGIVIAEFRGTTRTIPGSLLPKT